MSYITRKAELIYKDTGIIRKDYTVSTRLPAYVQAACTIAIKYTGVEFYYEIPWTKLVSQWSET